MKIFAMPKKTELEVFNLIIEVFEYYRKHVFEITVKKKVIRIPS